MAQFDVYANKETVSKKHIPYLLDVQAEMLDGLVTRVVIPLYVAKAIPNPITTLNPVFTINKAKVVMSTAELAGVPHKILGQKVLNMSKHRNDIIAALDLLLTGV